MTPSEVVRMRWRKESLNDTVRSWDTAWSAPVVRLPSYHAQGGGGGGSWLILIPTLQEQWSRLIMAMWWNDDSRRSDWAMAMADGHWCLICVADLVVLLMPSWLVFIPSDWLATSCLLGQECQQQATDHSALIIIPSHETLSTLPKGNPNSLHIIGWSRWRSNHSRRAPGRLAGTILYNSIGGWKREADGSCALVDANQWWRLWFSINSIFSVNFLPYATTRLRWKRSRWRRWVSRQSASPVHVDTSTECQANAPVNLETFVLWT